MRLGLRVFWQDYLVSDGMFFHQEAGDAQFSLTDASYLGLLVVVWGGDRILIPALLPFFTGMPPQGESPLIHVSGSVILGSLQGEGGLTLSFTCSHLAPYTCSPWCLVGTGLPAAVPGRLWAPVTQQISTGQGSEGQKGDLKARVTISK